jgi:putative FmdB family regulatory protein
MPLYEYRCRACGDTFDRLRPAAAADDPVECPTGHDDTVRLLSLFSAPSTARSESGTATGCCGGGCCG